jgi:hypothetical protein
MATIDQAEKQIDNLFTLQEVNCFDMRIETQSTTDSIEKDNLTNIILE